MESIAEPIVGGTITRNTVQVTLGEGKECDEILIGQRLGKAIAPGTESLLSVAACIAWGELAIQ